jgi:hypothetical protein
MILLGLPDLSWYNIPKRGKINKWPQNIPTACKVLQIYTINTHIFYPKNAQIIILGLKIYHLAILLPEIHSGEDATKIHQPVKSSTGIIIDPNNCGPSALVLVLTVPDLT